MIMCGISDLYTQHRQGLVAYAVRGGLNEMDAQDCVQDMFVLFIRKDLLAKLDESKNVLAWLRLNLRWVMASFRRKSGALCRGGAVEEVEMTEALAVEDQALKSDEVAQAKDVGRILAECGVTEDKVIWNPRMTNAERVALYRFRKWIAPQVKQRLNS